MSENEPMDAHPIEQDLLRTINTTPLLQSVLYDLDLLPEQLKRQTRQWITMLAFGYVYQEAIKEGRRDENNE